MKYTVTTRYSREHINEAARAYWKQTFALAFIASLLLMFLAFGRIFILNIRDWTSGTFLCFSFVTSTLFVWSYFIYRHRSWTIFAEMEVKTAQLTFSEKGIFVKSDASSTEIKWKMFKKIIKIPKIWLFAYKIIHTLFFLWQESLTRY